MLRPLKAGLDALALALQHVTVPAKDVQPPVPVPVLMPVKVAQLLVPELAAEVVKLPVLTLIDKSVMCTDYNQICNLYTPIPYNE